MIPLKRKKMNIINQMKMMKKEGKVRRHKKSRENISRHSFITYSSYRKS
ncbi:hypothetical protein BAXH7_03526 [Bacillus amyloliquefaciens XH7]|nr:hypothetical protein LL3_03535 [Bacillus amyloliquefaciens LL3]AEK90638.1 hypothetical protein BAXH7_03526 [Bacillus amyloliquefaciens XH7]KYC99200.1 hypothetical protein B425_3675 [Bacillus amyloliquefaciens]